MLTRPEIDARIPIHDQTMPEAWRIRVAAEFLSNLLTPRLSCERVNISERSELPQTARRLQRQLDHTRLEGIESSAAIRCCRSASSELTLRKIALITAITRSISFGSNPTRSHR